MHDSTRRRPAIPTPQRLNSKSTGTSRAKFLYTDLPTSPNEIPIMQFSNWLVFCGVALLVTFTPGPAVLMAISNAVAIGPRRALICSLGNATGLLVVSGVAMTGMGVILATSATAFMVVKLAGAGYLIYLGIRQWRRRTDVFSSIPVTAGSTQHSAQRLFGQGMAVALTNPKAILFFSALFPQFLVPEAPIVTQFTLLTLTFAACAIFSHLVYILLAGSLKNLLGGNPRSRLFNRLTGGAFVLLGLSLLRLPQKTA